MPQCCIQNEVNTKFICHTKLTKIISVENSTISAKNVAQCDIDYGLDYEKLKVRSDHEVTNYITDIQGIRR
ncbi:hypothetical protein ACFP1I_09750 [Dyadobacter subterraneus]|uniref:Uncharacterized protein n=1 Tax=Dyadobacter subterraneus TaxID=2773304 RepID=A0ABR9WAV5_9BACT|nr:hypothetical protein [Dyadobacter subterraneus]MBE9462614.1 hypothetical protein [Dyadobacter subterraneus]